MASWKRKTSVITPSCFISSLLEHGTLLVLLLPHRLLLLSLWTVPLPPPERCVPAAFSTLHVITCREAAGSGWTVRSPASWARMRRHIAEGGRGGLGAPDSPRPSTPTFASCFLGGGNVCGAWAAAARAGGRLVQAAQRRTAQEPASLPGPASRRRRARCAEARPGAGLRGDPGSVPAEPRRSGSRRGCSCLFLF